MSWTTNEISGILKIDVHHDGGTPEPAQGPSNHSPFNPRFTDAELKSIFEGNAAHRKNQIWYAGKLLVRKDAKCCACGATMPEGKVYIFVTGLYVPKDQTFSVERTFYFCAQLACINKKPFMSGYTHCPDPGGSRHKPISW